MHWQIRPQSDDEQCINNCGLILKLHLNLTSRWTQSGLFFQKSGHFFWFSKRAGEAFPLPIVTRLWIWLNMHQYPWTCLNILKSAWINCSDYARALNIPDPLTSSTGIWRCLGLWIWHGWMWKGYTEFRISLIVAPYAPIMSGTKFHNIGSR